MNARLRRIGYSVLVTATVAGCTSYHPLTLDDHPHLAGSVRELHADMPPNWPDATPVDLDRPLDMAAVTLLAVENNPDLVVTRADHALAQAQVVQAGILPNPQFAGSYTGLNAGPATAAGWSAALSADVRALLTYRTQLSSAKLSARQVDADILWQEWQVIGKAQLFYVDTIAQDRAIAGLHEAKTALSDRLHRDRVAVTDGNLTLSAISADVAALADLDRQLADAERQVETRRRDFDIFLGLAPTVRLDLVPQMAPQTIDAGQIKAELDAALARRPDLVALRLGYRAQDEQLYAAILGQFPAFILGGSAQRDTSRVYSGGPMLTMDLPIFNRNQGAIAIETATRQKLHDEYRNRWLTAQAEIQSLLADLALLQGQLAEARQTDREALRAADSARRANDAGLLDLRAAVDLVMASVTRQQEVIAIEQTLLEQQIALATVTGLGMPAIDAQLNDAGESEP